MKDLIGTGVALVTPFTANFEVDVKGLESVVNFQIENGIDYLVALGTTGESATLSKVEKQLVIDTVVSVNDGRVPLVLGIGGNNTAEVVAEFQTRNLDAFTAILSVSPMYSKPTQEGIYQHFSEIAKASDKPIILYNVPGRTGSNIEPETVARLAYDFENIVAVKEAAGDIVQAIKMIDQTPEGFLVISGDDMIALPMILSGGAGVISVIGQGFPKEFSNMVKLGLERNVNPAYSIYYKIVPVIDYIFAEGNPAGIKTVYSILGICSDKVRLPLVGVSAQLREKIERFIDCF
ncbi:4-hydroxy-tetrahydrodipicolinate synthase [Patiriisocius sp. Uisw_017]|jgi:4-hydroxy-tetrahydrodipicolinate synthase|uniref:4-hydroxy-tetrahydrodipicolinate synthase n=1 Tax=Patiriisocius sp. Uisw_017 TaxID=3230968 RepID=UPI0039E9A500